MATASAGRQDQGKTKAVVLVFYNGRIAEVRFNPRQRVRALLTHALNEFDVVSNREAMRLYDSAGVELPLDQSVQEAGIQPGDQLLLRQVVVGGGR